MLEKLALPEKEALCPMMAQAIKAFDDKDLKIFVEALEDPRWTAAELGAQISKLAFKVSNHQIHKHRNGSCACARNA